MVPDLTDHLSVRSQGKSCKAPSKWKIEKKSQKSLKTFSENEFI